jgi:peptide-methionine (S)-S-oxide reductase
MRNILLAGAAALAVGVAMMRVPAIAAATHAVPPPAVDIAPAPGLQTVVLSGGCFWGVQGVFEHVNGVERAVSGYAGGDAESAEYETVSTGTTGHAESVQVTYDPKKISFGHILQIFFSVVTDPTELNRQGPDEGTQYRGEIFATNADQARVARAYIAQLDAAHVFASKIATRVDMLPAFYPAEAYHQDFLVLHPDYPYIVFNDAPKVAALKATFPNDYRETPKLAGAKS